jgi:hypothetical protein
MLVGLNYVFCCVCVTDQSRSSRSLSSSSSSSQLWFALSAIYAVVVVVYPVAELHGCWTKFRQKPTLLVSAGAELPSRLLV